MNKPLLQTAHLVGACGAGMKALAEILLDAGWTLTGSDNSPQNNSIQSLVDRGLVMHEGHCESNLPAHAQTLIYSPAIPAENPERMAAAGRKLAQYSYSQMVGQLMKHSRGVCLAGTHGKSTTTAMTACILADAGRLSSAVVGAELCASGRNGWSAEGDLFVAESCEFQQSFLDFSPEFAAILNIEPDHFDCFADSGSLHAAFRRFASLLPADGILLVNSDCPAVCQVSDSATTKAKRISFGIGFEADWQATRLEPISEGQFDVRQVTCMGSEDMHTAFSTRHGIRFVVSRGGKEIEEIELCLPGRHNMMNALAATALCAEIGVTLESIRASLAQFQGIRRRLEYIGEWQGVSLFDDYAHHPTAVQVTLETLRQIVGSRRIWSVFQPHQISRTTALMSEFALSFGHADHVLIAPVFAAREVATDGLESIARELARRIADHGVTTTYVPSLDQIVTTLEDAIRPGDVIVTMGAGNIDWIQHEFTRRVQ